VASPVAFRELLVASAALAVLAVGVLGGHVAGGGFLSDDFSNAAKASAGSGLAGPLLSYRPGLAVALATPHEVLGPAPRAHLAWALALAVITSACFFALLRSAGLRPLGAGACASLLLLFPSSDATRLWATGAALNVALVLVLLGALVALRGLRRRSRGLHLAAVCLYVGGVLTYEAVGPVVLGSAVLYRSCAPWPRALRRGALDAGAVGAALAFVAWRTPRAVRPLEEWPGRAQLFASEGLDLLGRAVAPVPPWPAGVWEPAVVGALVAGISLSIALTVRSRGGWPDGLAGPLLTTGAGAFVVVSGYAPFVPAGDAYAPLASGLGNRVNAVAAPGFVLLVWSAATLAAYIVVGLLGVLRRGARGFASRAAEAVEGGSGGLEGHARSALAALGCLAIGASYAHSLRDDGVVYRRAVALQASVLDPLRARPLPAGARVYAFGQPVYAAPGVPVFRHWDLAGAAALATDDSRTAAYPLYPGTRLACGRRAVRPEGPSLGAAQESPYRSAFILDARTGRMAAIAGARDCRRKRAGVRPGPWMAERHLTTLSAVGGSTLALPR